MNAGVSKQQLWAGRILAGLVTVFLAFDAVGKFAKPQPVIDAMNGLGFPVSASAGIGTVLLLCTILYAVPRTAILGAVLLTGYLGGAVSIHVRAENPMFPIVFPVIMGVMMWAGIYLREPRLAALMPLRTDT
ncbi:MAG: DoxX family protein [Polyangiaceae bacterium]